MLHRLKIKQCYLIHIMEGKKTFEVRRNDRDFQVGDEIHFLPLEDENYNVYDGRQCVPCFEIQYVHTGRAEKRPNFRPPPRSGTVFDSQVGMVRAKGMGAGTGAGGQ